MSAVSATPLFIDTGAFYAWFDENTNRHERAATVFEGIEDGEWPYRPLYTSTYVVDELATLILSRQDHQTAVEAIESVRESVVQILEADDVFDETYEQFRQYDSRELSFTDHSTAVLANHHEIERVFTFDPDDFRTLGLTVVPDDTGEA
jgi:predicted nucleic acid-binding protein